MDFSKLELVYIPQHSAFALAGIGPIEARLIHDLLQIAVGSAVYMDALDALEYLRNESRIRAGSEIWHSMKRCNGDPCFDFNTETERYQYR